MSLHFFTISKTTFLIDKNETILFPDFIYKYNDSYPDHFEDLAEEYVYENSRLSNSPTLQIHANI